MALFSAMLWIYYAFIKTDEYLLITINSFGCVVETIYIAMFLAYAPKKIKIYATKVILVLNVGVFSLIVLSTLLLAKGPHRVKLLGWICVGFAVSVFAAPLSIIRQVIRTKSVEFMPFSLSFFLTLSAVVWFSYGLCTKDIYIAIPNILGFSFGLVQMVLYIVYKDAKELNMKDDKLPEFIVSTPKHSETQIAPQTVEEIDVSVAESKIEEEEKGEDDKKDTV
ncbi:bidirectional sugar transporter SWEET14-like [Asparagus officinalis]|nr:bidirectional sugar transporter SWEET14-like [Asparagus officinalis]